MKNFILNKITTMYAIYATTLFCKMCETSRKIHVDYDVKGVAKISAIDKMEFDRDNDEVFFLDDLTTKVTHRFNSGYYRTHGILAVEGGSVDFDSFKARAIVDGVEVVMNREEYLSSQSYRQDQARIVYPDGTVNTNADYVSRVLSEVNPVLIAGYADEDDSEYVAVTFA